MDTETRNAVRDGAIQSAAAVLGTYFYLHGKPDGMIDVGAGEGHWSVFAESVGVKRVHPLDLEEHTAFGIHVHPWDCEAEEPLDLMGSKRWPLGLCLEMAEHVTPSAGDHLVEQLVATCDRVLFSAAIPHQGGDGHVNEQWPDYWHAKFAAHGWGLHDFLRLTLWSDERVEPWYAQNTFIAMRDEVKLAPPRRMVHPAFYLSRVYERDACRGGA